MDFIDLIPANKNNLISLLKSEELFSESEETFDFSRITDFINSLIDDAHFLIELPYTDIHYRDSYYFYFAEKFKNYKRNTARIHIFPVEVNENNFQNENYLGFFIVRPLGDCPQGHSFVSPSAFKNKDFLCCLTKSKVSILGANFEIMAFPHVAQDSETQTCAESSLWSILNYFGTKYNKYKVYNPSEIIEKLNSFSGHRMLPSKGLSLEELSSCLNSCGQRCIIYTEKDNLGERFFSIMRIYIESGMPVVVLLNKKGTGHAVLAMGHENLSLSNTINLLHENAHQWNDISSVDKKLVFIDDNFPPYVMDSCSLPSERYKNTNLQDMKISAFVVPLQKHMYMDALDAYYLVSMVFDNPIYGLNRLGKEKWITRLLLTKSRSFKGKVLDDTRLDGSIREMLLKMSFPKFIWICEIFTEQSYTNEECKGILILDSTGRSDSLSSVLLYYVNNFIIEHNGLGFTKKNIVKEVFSKDIYRNNLREGWILWKD